MILYCSFTISLQFSWEYFFSSFSSFFGQYSFLSFPGGVGGRIILSSFFLLIISLQFSFGPLTNFLFNSSHLSSSGLIILYSSFTKSLQFSFEYFFSSLSSFFGQYSF